MMNKVALSAVIANRENLVALAKTMTREQLLAMDATLDTMVFGKPLGLMGEGIMPARGFNPNLAIENVDYQECVVID